MPVGTTQNLWVVENTRLFQPKTRNRSHSLFHNWVSISKVLLFNSINIQIVSNWKDLRCIWLNLYVYIAPCFLNIFFKRGTPKILFHIPRNPYQWKWKQKNEAIGSARRLLHHCQKSEKRSCNISTDIWYFRRALYFICIYSTISRKTPNHILRNPEWEIMLY
jgi:hypothetical protein